MDNEYLYKLGVDASDLDAAISVTVSILGELEAALGSKMPRATAAFVGGLEKVRTGMQDVAADGAKVVATANDQAAALTKATTATNEAAKANAALIQSYRQMAVEGTSSGVGTSNQVNAALLNTQQVTGIGNRAAQQEYAAQASAQQLAAMRAYYAEEAQAAKVTAETLAQLDAERTQRVEAMYAQFRAEDEAYNQGNLARYGQATGDFVGGAGTTNARNSAALNSSTTARSQSLGAQAGYADQANSAVLSQMSAYYAAQEKTALGTVALTKAQADQTSNLPRLRYALYDVSMAFGIAGTALTGVGAAVQSTTVQYQALFAQVQRTSSLNTGNLSDQLQLKQLKSDLIGITTELPATFADVTNIATLGNQLGIPATALVNFTKTVTEFAAETNVSTDAAATAFGRLGQILHTTDYKSLGDEIAYLGVRAVATESDIIKVAQQIAVTTTSYGLNEKQTLALATAYASLGIKAESARGTTSRAFSDIATAVQGGGTQLEEIARVSGLSSQAFAEQWKTNANQAFIDFVTGLGKAGSNAKSILAELHITAQRDITNISLLGQNIQVLNQANTDAGNSAGYMDHAYQTIANTVQSQLTIAGNKVQSIFNQIGTSTSTPVAGLVKGLNDVLDVLDAISKDPVAAGGLGITVAVIAATGAVLLGVAALASFKANALAVGTAVDQLGLKNTTLKGTFDILVRGKLADTSATKAQTEALAELAAAEQNASDKGLALAGVTDVESASAKANALANGEQAVGVAGQAGAAGLKALGTAGADAAGAAGIGGLFDILLGPVGLAIGIGTLLLPLLPAVADGFQNWIDKSTGAAVSTDQLTASIKGLTAAHAEEALGQANASLQTATQVAGGSSGGRGNGQRTPGQSGAQLYYDYTQTGQYTTGFDAFGQKQNIGQRAGQEIQTYDQSLAGLAQAKNYTALTAGLKEYESALSKTGLSQKQLDGLLTQTSAALGATKGQTLEAALAAKSGTDATGKQTSSQAQLNDSLTNYLADAFGASTKTDALSTALTALGKDFVTSGADSASGGTAMQNAIKAIVNQAGDVPKARSELEGLYQSLIKMGVATPAQLTGLLSLIKAYGGTGTAAGTAVPGISAFVDALNKAQAAADKTSTSTQVAERTLLNYGSDLKSVLDNMDTYQFGAQDSLDKISSAWTKIKTDAATASASIATIKADLLTLEASRSQSSYDVKIAQMYGDQIGEAKAQAALAKDNADIATKQNDLAKAKDASSKSLTGNSAGAIANRADLESNLKLYQDYIVSLAQSGASQKQIQAAVAASRAEFVRQSTQLGLSKKDVDTYAKAFDGMSQIVKAVPRNITTGVTANTSAAQKALADYQQSIKGVKAEAAKPVHLAAPVVSPASAPKVLGAQIGTDILTGLNTTLSPQQQKNIIQLLGGTPNSVAQGLLPSSAGVPIYNYQGTPLAAANQGRAPYSSAPQLSVSATTKNALTAADKQFLASLIAGKPAIAISASQFGKAVENAYVRAGMGGAG